MNVVRADWRLLDAYFDLRYALYLEECLTQGQAPDRSEELKFRLRADCANTLLEAKCHVLIAFDGTKPVGLLTLEEGQMAGANLQAALMVRGAFVEPTYRSGSVGSAFWRLFRAGLEISAKSAITKVQASVAFGNEGVLALAGRIGFRPISYILEKRLGFSNTGSTHEQALRRARSERAAGSGGGSSQQSLLPADAAVDGNLSRRPLFVHP